MTYFLGERSKLNEKLRTLEADLQNKADATEIDRLQRRIENIEKSIRKWGGGVRTKTNHGQL